MANFRKILFGEKIPDKNDPKYKERYEKDVEAGRKFAKLLHIDKVVAYIQLFANKHTKLFLFTVFGIVICCFGLNIYNLGRVYKNRNAKRTAAQAQELHLRGIRTDRLTDSINIVKHYEPRTDQEN